MCFHFSVTRKEVPDFFCCAGIGDQDFRTNSAVNFLKESGGIDDLKEERNGKEKLMTEAK